MAFTRIDVGGDGDDGRSASPTCTPPPTDRELAGEDVLRAAEAATAWAGEAPLVFGGDLNLRPAQTPAAFDALRERFGLAAPTGPRAIDHLLARGLETVEPPHPWPPERRELAEGGRALRLSDHAPVKAEFATPS